MNATRTGGQYIDHTQTEHTGGEDSFVRRTIIIIGVTLLIIFISFFLWYVLQVLLLVFAGLLLALLLHIPTDWLSSHSRLSNRWSLLLVILVGVAALTGLGWLFFPEVADQIDQIIAMLPGILAAVQDNLQQYTWTRRMMQQTPPVTEIIPSASNVLARISDVFSGVIGLVASMFIILFIGLYLAVQPELYVRGVTWLFPKQGRARAHTVLGAVGHALKGWLLGRIFAMIMVGVLVGIGLWLLDVPFALTLGITTGLLSFIPIVGAILAVIPAGIIALAQSPMLLLYVLLLYYGAQLLESYVLTPMVQQRVVALPPALALVAQLLMGVLAGPMGVALAVPITVVGMVMVKLLYIEDVLGDPVDV